MPTEQGKKQPFAGITVVCATDEGKKTGVWMLQKHFSKSVLALVGGQWHQMTGVSGTELRNKINYERECCIKTATPSL